MGLFVYIILMTGVITHALFLLGDFLVGKFPNSKFSKIWRTYICDEDPDDR